MIEYKNINSNETGLSVRAKLNKMFSELINGTEGVNTLWRAFKGVENFIQGNNTEVDNLKKEIQGRFFDTLNYTDREIADLLTYINGIYGGVNGFAEDVNFKPEYPIDKAATVIGVGPGTFINLLDESGTPITIDSQEIVIFFKSAGSNYWSYKTVLPTIVQSEITEELGDSNDKVISQKFFTQKIKNVVGGTIDIADIDTYDNFDKVGLYSINSGETPAGSLFVIGDPSANLVHQFIFGGFSADKGGLMATNGVSIIFRTRNISSTTSDILIGTWGEWRAFQDEFMQVLSEDEYEELNNSGKLEPNKFYFLYEES